MLTSLPLDKIAEVLGKGTKPQLPTDYLQLYLAYAAALSIGDHETSATATSVRSEGMAAPDVQRPVPWANAWCAGRCLCRQDSSRTEHVRVDPLQAGTLPGDPHQVLH